MNNYLSQKTPARRQASGVLKPAGAAPRGFTLIELLVVIAIIAIIAAILFPVFAQARAKARQTADLSNIRQLGIAMMMCTQDYDETTVRTHHDLDTGETVKNLYTWFDPLQSYIKSKDLLTDPGLNDDICPYYPTTDNAATDTYTSSHTYVGGEAPNCILPSLQTLRIWNSHHTDYPVNSLASHGLPIAEISSPAQQVLFGERHAGLAIYDYHPWPSASNGSWERGYLDGSLFQLDPASSTGDQIADSKNLGRHTGGNNYGFLDGHAKRFKYGNTLDATRPVKKPVGDNPDAVADINTYCNVGNLPRPDVCNWGMHNHDDKPSNE